MFVEGKYSETVFTQCHYNHGIEDVKPPRDLRSRRAAATRARIIEAAGQLFDERGYAATTIEAIAVTADVAVETVYSKFRNKRNLLNAYLETAIVGDATEVPLLSRPAVAAIRSSANQHDQIEQIAQLIRGVLQRTAAVQAVLRSATAVDPEIDSIIADDDRRRKITHRTFVEMIASNGPLSKGLTLAEATDTLSALANPDMYSFVTKRRGWSAARYQKWLASSLTKLLL